ncbi:hypothetical protein VF04_04525 [Nostoc linckia z7]|uniref:DUF2184 domain-containing protein n=2 Tax=Nostoc linckia TaxID=92942 RepID=A0A9Q5ZFY5_NOSLI|nr:major capsid family protein [Nostoc linckia]PHK42974.1 hypothetical protein VF12_01225 [Nostoc linckia z15]PHK48131.1 hypothetical protein VF13_02200 [Nostoc linckia z16]PHJ64915.1 hypothetical protein VF02_11250 [Nostoc linckia z1]PHJ70092.1 hypothetical protein VF05_11405 [Nostoc linckia z3]PHJ74993.1 hypothetical protein VF03_11565 [Nostoc linckia z2]
MPISSQIRLDAPTVGAFEQQLELKETEVMKRMLPEYKAASGKLFQIEEINAPWAQTTSFTSIDGVGTFELDTGDTTNLPYVDMVGDEYYQRTFRYRSGYYFDEDEIAATLHRGIPIEDQKVSLVQQAYTETMNKLLLVGDKKTGNPGFINHPAWLRSIAPYKLDGSVTSANSILATLNAGVQGMKNATNKVMAPDTLLLAERRYDFLMSQLRLNDFQEKSVLKFFLENNPSIKNIEPLAELEQAGPNGEDLAIFYKRDPNCFKARITDAFRPRPLQNVGPFKVYRAYSFKFAGLVVYRRYSCHVMIGI